MMRERAINRAQAMRNQALSVAMKRKEEFLGARVPKELRDKVTARANEQGIPVSILIRNILEEAFKASVSVVNAYADKLPQEGSVPDGGSPAAFAQAGAAAAPGSSTSAEAVDSYVVRFPAVLGWEMIRLNRRVDCSSCGKSLLPGTSVTLGLTSGVVQAGATHIILCDRCITDGRG